MYVLFVSMFDKSKESVYIVRENKKLGNETSSLASYYSRAIS